MLAARIMQHIPEWANQLTSSRNHFTLGAPSPPRPTHPAGDVLRKNTMIFTIICVAGLVASGVATAHAIWVRGI